MSDQTDYHIFLNPTPRPASPVCAACGVHPVPQWGMLCNVYDKDETWMCAEKSAYFAARMRGIVWAAK